MPGRRADAHLTRGACTRHSVGARLSARLRGKAVPQAGTYGRMQPVSRWNNWHRKRSLERAQRQSSVDICARATRYMPGCRRGGARLHLQVFTVVRRCQYPQRGRVGPSCALQQASEAQSGARRASWRQLVRRGRTSPKFGVCNVFTSSAWLQMHSGPLLPPIRASRST